MDYKDYKGIWVFAQQDNGVVEPTAFELLNKAQELKKVSGDIVTAVLVGSEFDDQPKKLIAQGADQVIVLQNPNLAEYSGRPYEKVLVEAVKKYKPSIFLFGATVQGRDLAPRVMTTLETGLTADAIDLGYDEDGAFVQTCPAFGGELLDYICIPERRPQMVTVRSHVFDPAAADDSRTGDIIVDNVEVDADDCYEVIESTPIVVSGKPITDCDILVSGGRGIKSEEDLKLLQEFAELIGGEVACSRPLVDVGWMDHSKQIGQSGTTVKPKYIFNIGISGSVQYIVGMEKAETITTINTYDRADLFGISNYGAVADYTKLLPAIIAEIKKRKNV